MSNGTCKTCGFWKRQEIEVGDYAYCQKYAPQPIVVPQWNSSPAELYEAKWPLTQNTGWCGDYEKKKLPSVYENRAPELS